MNRLKLMKKIIRRTTIKTLVYQQSKTNKFFAYTKNAFFLMTAFFLSATLFGCASARFDYVKESTNAHKIVLDDLVSAGLNEWLEKSVSYRTPVDPNTGYAVLEAVYKLSPYKDFNEILSKIGSTLPENFYARIYPLKQAPPLNEFKTVIKKDNSVIAEINVSQQLNGVIAFIIDDVGNNSKALEQSLMIKRPVTYAVLPKLKLTKKLARILHDNGHVIILHQPMASVNDIYPGPGYIEKDMSDNGIIALLDENFSELPWVKGMNNHMGSATTADEHKMEIVLKYLKQNNFFFLDSVTGKTVCSKVAAKIGYPIYTRDVFIDNKSDKDYINKQIDQLVMISVTYGEAIGIGHFKPLTMQCIYERQEDFDRQGIKLVYINELSR